MKAVVLAYDNQRCSGLAGCGRVGFVKVNRATPPVSVVPVLSYPDVRAAVAWLSAAFGFVERTRIGESHRAQMSIGADGAVIVAELHGEKSEHEDAAGTELGQAMVVAAALHEPPTVSGPTGR